MGGLVGKLSVPVQAIAEGFTNFQLDFASRHTGLQGLSKRFIPNQPCHGREGNEVLHLPARRIGDYKQQVYRSMIEGTKIDPLIGDAQSDNDLIDRVGGTMSHGHAPAQARREYFLPVDHGFLELVTATQSGKNGGLVNQLPDSIELILA